MKIAELLNELTNQPNENTISLLGTTDTDLNKGFRAARRKKKRMDIETTAGGATSRPKKTQQT
jgi:hypothetical protein